MFSNRILHLYTDGAPETIKAGKNLKTCHDTSTPYRSATNGIAEREIRNVLEGTRTLLEHSGLPNSYWPYASRPAVACAIMRIYAWWKVVVLGVNATSRDISKERLHLLGL